ncbi:ISAs1 family transposase [Burkholderia sp. WP9]|uniref:ISAs1 family transposase n=1 Tax=Burkholderia sp. WP9 TaxID=1500263 RepID=UPI00115F8ABB|nr:ISAs1 family transposase [Burkholderia sp. WP9]
MALDGKALRGSASRLDDVAARHIVSAFDQHGLIVLGHVEVAEKSNEIPAAQKLIESIGLKGRVSTMDALHCQEKRCARAGKRSRRAGAGQGQPANLACRM